MSFFSPPTRRDFESWEPHLQDTAAVLFDDAVNPQIGPAKLIAELVGPGRYRQVVRVGKVIGLERVQTVSLM